MHYLQLFITEKDDEKGTAREQVEEFLERYQDIFWDWYEIGGRWKDLFNGENTVPLRQALPKIKEMYQDYVKDLNENKKEIIELISNAHDVTQIGSYHKCKIKNFGERLYTYCDEALVYNLDSFELYDVPKENLDNYEVTIIDIHN
jgi:hypothetical protein